MNKYDKRKLYIEIFDNFFVLIDKLILDNQFVHVFGLQFFDKYYKNWSEAKFYWIDYNYNPKGILINDKKLDRNKKLNNRDFLYFSKKKITLLAKVYLKDKDIEEEFIISKDELSNNFVSFLYDHYQDNWYYFETFFLDTNKLAYGVYHNTPYSKKIYRILPGIMKKKLYANNRKIFPKKIIENKFYVIVFKNSTILKIGITEQKIEKRIIPYIFPRSTEEKKFYDGLDIDYEKSFYVLTNDNRKIEKELKKKFKNYRFFTEGIYRSNEILKAETLSFIIDYLHLNNFKTFNYINFP